MTTETDPNRIVIFDTTLRDGEQSPGASMNLEEKVRIAQVLEEMGVDVIEAGFPISSPGDFEAVHAIAKQIRTSTVCGLARAVRSDIEKVAEAIKPAPRGRIHTFISTSPLHMKFKLRLDPDQVHERIIDSVTYARRFTDDVEFSLDEAAGVIHVRSASRIGHGDRGVNRARVEAIRSAFMASPAGLPAGAGAAR